MSAGNDAEQEVQLVEEGQDGSNNALLLWPALRRFFSNIKEKNAHNITGVCCYCKKTYSCSKSSSSNFEKHLKTHPSLVPQYEKEKNNAKEAAAILKSGKRPRADSSTGQGRLDTFVSPSSSTSRVTQAGLNAVVMEYIAMESEPFSKVESSYFRNLALFGLKPSAFTVLNRKSLVTSLQQQVRCMENELRKTLEGIEYVATTADAWSKFHRSCMGITVHWIDPETLQRKSAAFAVRRLKGRHTYDVLASAIDQVHKEFAIQNKVCKTTTDNAANFVKAFCEFTKSDTVEAESSATTATTDMTAATSPADVENNDLEDEEDWSSVPISELLDSQDDMTDIFLPPHQRCSAHTLNLVASKDAPKARKSTAYRNAYRSCSSKLKKLWKKQNMSTRNAEIIHEKLGVYLISPNDTRWNSEYDGCAQVADFLESPNKVEKMQSVFDAVGLTRLTDDDIKFLLEFRKVMGYVARSLDILQAEKKMYYGYFLPTLVQLKRNLQQLLVVKENEPPQLHYCAPLVTTLLQSIEDRFSRYMQDNDAIIAACSHPKFKFAWIDNRSDSAKAMELLKEAVANEIKKDRVATDSQSESQPRTSGHGGTERKRDQDDVDDDDFFTFSTLPDISDSSPMVAADEEIQRFINTTGTDVSQLHAFPYIKKVFVRTNTPLPSSAAVERLFSLAGIVMSVKRARLSDDNFEMQVLLKANRQYVKF